jgi:DNA-binding NtrC family response regulator
VHKRESTATARRPRASARPGAHPPAVLCVQQRHGEVIKRLVRTLQAPLRHCSGGREAIEIASERALSCVIAPLVMPDMAAKALIEALREVAPGLAVIVIADNPAVSEAVSVMRGGAHAVVDSRILTTGLLLQLAPLLRGR